MCWIWHELTPTSLAFQKTDVSLRSVRIHNERMKAAKTIHVPIRMTASERENLHKAAKAQGTNAAELIRRGLKSQGVNL